MGKTALVTGGGSGIGKSASLLFAREGAAVCVVDRNGDAAIATATLIGKEGGKAVAIAADVSQEGQVAYMIEQAVQSFGVLDCCFNNAGIGSKEANTGGLLADIDLQDWQRMITVNLTGVFLCLKYQLRVMRERGGSIVNMGSICGLTAMTGASAYVASKHGVVALTKSAAIEYGHLGIRVNAICPGHIATALLKDSTSDQEIELLKRSPLNRYGTTEEIAELAVWLSSDKASFVNGATLVADGGRLAGG